MLPTNPSIKCETRPLHDPDLAEEVLLVGDMAEGTGTLVASALVIGFAIVAVALRFYVRTRLKVGVAWDDWSIFIGLVLTLITAGLLVWST